MNWKLFGTMVTLIGVGASVALGQGTTPTIVQGDYISNVFGNSNFVQNPNAKLNATTGVAVSSATVTRSTTTPLVATSEFNITTSTSTGYADWSLRAFDQGMKNNNCEARFTYRGFSVGSTTAQILQGANVVAQLTLTASTDPRIASINFPCGDLSAVTKFRLQQATASLTGTNEIGAIYTGLATNMANVAQAEEVGTAVYQGGTSCGWSKAGPTTGYESFAAAGGTCNWTSTGSVTAQTKLLKFDATLKPGKYQAILNTTLQRSSGSNNDPKFVLTDGTVYSGTAGPYQDSTTAMQVPGTFILTFEVTTTTSKTIELKVALTSGLSGGVIGYNGDYFTRFALYRFPSSSELVVTPERQNWFVAGTFSGGNPNLGTAAVSSLTEIIDGALTFTPAANSQPAATLCSSTNAPPALSTSGTTCAAGSESVGITYNIPSVGTYEVCAQGTVSVDLAANGFADTKFSIQETAINSNTATSNYSAPANVYIKTASSAVIDSKPFRVCQIISYSSIGQKAVRLMYQQVVGATVNTNLLLMDSTQGRQFNWTVTPVTNQSNSALYVQGPVLGAQTGAAIPASYVGEVKQSAVTSGITASNTRTAVTSIVLTPGVWRVHGVTNIDAAIPGYGDLEVSISPDNTSTATWFNRLTNGTLLYPSNAAIGQLTHSAATAPVYVHYDGTNLTYLSGGVKTGSTAGNTIYLKVRAVYTTLYNQWHYIVAERIN